MKSTSALLLSLIAVVAVAAQPGQPLARTLPLTWPEADLSTRLMDGAHQFIERKISEAAGQRGKFWPRDFSSPEAYQRSIQPNRDRLRVIVGAVDPREPPRMERWGDDATPALVAETSK